MCYTDELSVLNLWISEMENKHHWEARWHNDVVAPTEALLQTDPELELA